MAENSLPWGGTQPGDAGPYTDDNWSDVWRELYTSAPASQGPVRGYGGELAVTNPAPTTIRVDTGIGIVDGKFYRNTAGVDFAIQAPVAGTNYYRVVLRKSWAAQTVRAALLGPNPADYPALTQVDSNIWEIPLARVNITSGAAVSILDDRDWAETALSTSATSLPDAFADNTLDGAKLKDNTVPGGKLMDLGVTGGKIANLVITNGKIAEGTIAGSKLAGLTVTGAQIANTTITSGKIALHPKAVSVPMSDALNITDGTVISVSRGTYLLPDNKQCSVFSQYWRVPHDFAGNLMISAHMSWLEDSGEIAWRGKLEAWWADVQEPRNAHYIGASERDINCLEGTGGSIFSDIYLMSNDPYPGSFLYITFTRLGAHANDNYIGAVTFSGFIIGWNGTI